jgi:hypothetical protein
MKIDEIFEVTHVCTLSFTIPDNSKCELLLRVGDQSYPVTVIETIAGSLLIKTITVNGFRQRSFEMSDEGRPVKM